MSSSPRSGWRLSTAYADFDAEQRFAVTDIHTAESAICRSGEVLQGLIKPHECEAFGRECTPRNPLGATMVSSEGACAAYYLYRRLSEPLMPEDRAAIDIDGWVCPAPLRDSPVIVMGHGGGGAMSAELVEHLFLPAFGAAADANMGDSRGARDRRTATRILHRLVRGQADVLPRRLDRSSRRQRHGQRPRDGGRDAVGLVDRVHPRRRHGARRTRPGGRAVGDAARIAGVKLVTGDTKVVDSGSGDGVYINTAGIGLVADGVDIRPERASRRRRDRQRRHRRARGGGVELPRGPRVRHQVASDCAALNGLVADMIATGADIHALRDPTRGGVAASLNEIARVAAVGITLTERDLPIPQAVRDACGLLGLDPLYVANEGKLLAIVARADADQVLAAMQRPSVGCGSAHDR